MRSFKDHVDEALVPQPGTQYGSNPGGLHTDDQTGENHYVKHYQNPDQGRVEALAGKIYHHMGIATTQPEFHPDVNGKHAVVSKWNPNLEQMHHSEFKKFSPEQHQQIGRMYHAAVLTKNWDMVGLVHDNIVRHRETGELHSVDHGGSFHFRARGAPKEYGPDIAEHHSLIHSDNAAGEVFSHSLGQPGAYEAGKRAVEGMNMDHVKGLFQSSGLHNHEDLYKNFAERRSKLLAAPSPYFGLRKGLR